DGVNREGGFVRRRAGCGIFLVPAADSRAAPDGPKDRRHPPPIRVDLHVGPRIIGHSRVLGLDADEARVARADVLPDAGSGVIAAPRGDHVVRPVSTEAYLR